MASDCLSVCTFMRAYTVWRRSTTACSTISHHSVDRCRSGSVLDSLPPVNRSPVEIRIPAAALSNAIAGNHHLIGSNQWVVMLGVWGGNRGPGGKYSRVYVFGHLRTNCPNSGTSSGPLRSFQLWEYLYLKPSQGGDSFRADQLLGSPSGMNVISRFYSWWLMHTFSFLAILLLITYLMTKMFAVKYVTCSCAQTYWLGNFINVRDGYSKHIVSACMMLHCGHNIF